MLAYGLLAERALGPEIGHADRFLEAATGRDHFAENAGDPLGGERPGVRPGHAAQDLGLALGLVGGDAFFQRADAAGESGAAVDES